MSNTRRAAAGAPLAQERYLSSPEFARPINGVALAARASLLTDPAARSLLYWIQARSMEAGGLCKLAAQLVAAFPERVGSETMRQHPRPAGGRWPQKLFESICRELNLQDLDLTGDMGFSFPDNTPRFAAEAFDRCRTDTLDKLPRLLTELCINPRLEVKAGLAHRPTHREFGATEGQEFTTATLPTFDDVIAALFELQRADRARLPDTFAETEISRKVFATLDYALKTRRMVLIEGREGVGKTEAARAWAAQHEGEAHFVSASGICNKTTLFREISRALGIGASYTRKSSDMQARVEDVLKRSRTLLILDESHFLWGHSERISARPELIDWLHTIYNHGVAIALLCTPQLLLRMTRTEQQTGWNGGQFKRRVKRWALLPDHPSEADFKSVARKLLPDADDRAREAAVLYAVTSKRNMSALVDAVDEAKLIATEAGRSRIMLADMRTAISDYRLPSDNAMYRSVEPPRTKRAGRPGRLAAMPLPQPGSDTAMALPAREITPRPGGPNRMTEERDEQEEPAHA